VLRFALHRQGQNSMSPRTTAPWPAAVHCLVLHMVPGLVIARQTWTHLRPPTGGSVSSMPWATGFPP